jgi:competence protein ComEC
MQSSSVGLSPGRFAGKMLGMSAAVSNVVPPSSPPARYQPLVIVLAAAAAGILLDRFGPLRVWAWWMIAAGGLGCWLLAWRSARVWLGSLALCLAMAATAGAWHHCRWYLLASDDLGRYGRVKPQPTCVEAIAVRMPRRLPLPAFDPMQMLPPREGCRLDVDAVAVRDGANWRPASGKATLEVRGPPPEVHAGDRFRCFARLSAPAGPRNPGAWDSSAQLRAEGVHSRLLAEVPQCLSVVQSGPWLGFSALLDQVRGRSDRLLEHYLDPQSAEMAEAVLLGQREEMESARTENFMATGTVHLLVIAGLHLGILAGALFWVTRRLPLPPGWAPALVAAATLLYMLVVDARPPIVRATVLVLVMCAAAYSGRRPLSFNSLAAAALVVLAINPNDLFHVGAQLSFLSVAGLMWFAPGWIASGGQQTLDRLIAENLSWPERILWAARRSLRHFTLISATIWALTMPLVMARFHLCTPAAVVLNPLVWLPMAFGLIGGALLLVFGALAPPLACLCGAFCNWDFWLLEWLVGSARHVPGSHFWWPGPADWWLWGFYGGLGLWAAFARLRPPRRWFVALVALWVAVGLGAATWPHNRDRLDCTFLSMGHGCAVLLELPSGQAILYDAGRFDAPALGSRTIAECLWHHGMTRLDAVVLSHPDLDHYNALPGLLEKFSVRAVYVSSLMFEKQNQAVVALRKALDRHGIAVREVRAGDRLRTGSGSTIEVLHPPRFGVIGSDNANSVVLAVDYGGHEILLPGDLESPGLDDVLAEEPRRCDVLLAPHHGSRQSNSPELAKWCTPGWVVISGDGRWNLPETEAAYRGVGARVLHTYDSGAIAVRITAERVQVSPFVEPRRAEE